MPRPSGAAATTGRDKVLQELRDWESKVARWSAEAIAKQAEARDVRARMGDVVLADEGAAATVAAELRELEDAAQVAESAAEAADPHLHAARVAVLEFDAVAYENQAAHLHKRLKSHESKTQDLLSELEAHEGPYVPEIRHVQALMSTGIRVQTDDGRPLSYTNPKSDSLRRAIATAEARAAVLRDVIAGVDPEIRVRALRSVTDSKVFGLTSAEFYPPALRGSDAVVAAPLGVDA